MAKARLLVAGNGMAGLKFIEELLAIEPHRWAITAVGEEPHAAYNRVLLSPLLAGEIAAADIQTKGRDWYAENNIDLITGVTVTSLDRAAKQAVLSDGQRVAYDICVVATGSTPIRLNLPGAQLPGVEVFRSVDDVARLTRAAAGSGRIVVIGGGLLGIEAAYGLKRAGADVTLLHVMDRLMERQLDATAAELLRDAIQSKGIDVVLRAETLRIDGAQSVEQLVLKSGQTIAASHVVMAVGVRPRIDIAAASGLTCQRGIIVDDQMRTSDRDVYAIGECAEHCGSVYGLVEPAYEHARVAANAIAGRAVAYRGTVLATNLKVSGVPVFSAGDFEGEGAEHIVWHDRQGPAYRKFVVRDGSLAGVVLVGDTTDALWYRDLIRSRAPITAIRSTLALGRSFAEAA